MRWGVADTFRFEAEAGTEKAICGGRLSTVDGARILVSLPSSATIKLIANGSSVVQTVSDELEYAVKEPGVYRVEAWKGKRGWIFSNHIRIGM
jgi:hypothetical protein